MNDAEEAQIHNALLALVQTATAVLAKIELWIGARIKP